MCTTPHVHGRLPLTIWHRVQQPQSTTKRPSQRPTEPDERYSDRDSDRGNSGQSSSHSEAASVTAIQRSVAVRPLWPSRMFHSAENCQDDCRNTTKNEKQFQECMVYPLDKRQWKQDQFLPLEHAHNLKWKKVGTASAPSGVRWCVSFHLPTSDLRPRQEVLVQFPTEFVKVRLLQSKTLLRGAPAITIINLSEIRPHRGKRNSSLRVL